MKRVTYWPQAWLGRLELLSDRENTEISVSLRPGDQHDIPRGLELTSWATQSRIWSAYLWFVVVSNIYVFVLVN